jgi:hypothetical protein
MVRMLQVTLIKGGRISINPLHILAIVPGEEEDESSICLNRPNVEDDQGILPIAESYDSLHARADAALRGA